MSNFVMLSEMADKAKEQYPKNNCVETTLERTAFVNGAGWGAMQAEGRIVDAAKDWFANHFPAVSEFERDRLTEQFVSFVTRECTSN